LLERAAAARLAGPSLLNDPRPADEVSALGNASWVLAFTDDPSRAVDTALRALAIDPNQAWIEGNLAHGYLLTGRADDARKIYQKQARLMTGSPQSPFANVLLDDFAALRDAGIVRPEMDEIEAMLRKAVTEMQP
jgi:hypothetical protein